MHSLCLIRHGDSVNDILTPNGCEQIRLASERWKRHSDAATVSVYHAPAECTKLSARIFEEVTGIESTLHSQLWIGHYHDKSVHHSFARWVAALMSEHVVLIGHDETRRICEAIVALRFHSNDRPPYLPEGGVLKFQPSYGYQII